MIIVSVPPALSFQSKTRSLLRGALPGCTETLIDFFCRGRFKPQSSEICQSPGPVDWTEPLFSAYRDMNFGPHS